VVCQVVVVDGVAVDDEGADSEEDADEDDEDEEVDDVAVEALLDRRELRRGHHRVHLELGLHASVDDDADHELGVLEPRAAEADVLDVDCVHGVGVTGLRDAGIALREPQLPAELVELVVGRLHQQQCVEILQLGRLFVCLQRLQRVQALESPFAIQVRRLDVQRSCILRGRNHRQVGRKLLLFVDLDHIPNQKRPRLRLDESPTPKNLHGRRVRMFVGLVPLVVFVGILESRDSKDKNETRNCGER